MASRVDYTKIVSEARNNVVDLIKDNSKVSDPVSASAEFRKWVYSREPDVKNATFSGYPFMIANGSNVAFPDEGKSCDGKISFVMWSMEIEVITSDRGYGDKDAKGMAHSDAITDDILQIFNDVTTRRTLRANGLSFSTPDVTGIVPTPIANEMTYRRSIFLSFKSRIPISV